MERSPCKDCTRRYLGCHSKCPEYKSFRAARDKELEENIKRKGILDVRYDRRKKMPPRSKPK